MSISNRGSLHRLNLAIIALLSLFFTSCAALEENLKSINNSDGVYTKTVSYKGKKYDYNVLVLQTRIATNELTNILNDHFDDNLASVQDKIESHYKLRVAFEKNMDSTLKIAGLHKLGVNGLSDNVNVIDYDATLVKIDLTNSYIPDDILKKTPFALRMVYRNLSVSESDNLVSDNFDPLEMLKSERGNLEYIPSSVRLAGVSLDKAGYLIPNIVIWFGIYEPYTGKLIFSKEYITKFERRLPYKNTDILEKGLNKLFTAKNDEAESKLPTYNQLLTKIKTMRYDFCIDSFEDFTNSTNFDKLKVESDKIKKDIK